MKIKIYYAHPITSYNSPQETSDLITLGQLGFTVFNPNCHEVAKQYEAARKRAEKNPDFDAFEYVFKPLVMACDGVALRSFADFRIGAGVSRECNWAVEEGRPVIELPTWLRTRFLTVSETKERIRKMREDDPDWERKTNWFGPDPRDENH